MAPLVYINENIFNLKKTNRLIEAYLNDTFHESIARVDAALFDEQTFKSYYLILNLGGFFQISGKTLVLPVETYGAEDLGEIKTGWRREPMLGVPSPTNLMNIRSFEEELIRDYHGLQLQRPL